MKGTYTPDNTNTTPLAWMMGIFISRMRLYGFSCTLTARRGRGGREGCRAERSLIDGWHRRSCTLTAHRETDASGAETSDQSVGGRVGGWGLACGGHVCCKPVQGACGA